MQTLQYDTFLSQNSIILNQIIRTLTFSDVDSRARILQYKFLSVR
jgi:hypothetical protein